MMNGNNNMCAGMETKLADLLLDPENAPAKVKTHVAACDGCQRELEELRATMGLMDAWEAPEPNPYWTTRFEARLREEKAKPASWLERLKARIAYGPQMQTRPLVALTMALVVLLGGGTYLDIYWEKPASVPPQTAVVHDLQTLDNNAQLLDQMESIADDQGPDQN